MAMSWNAHMVFFKFCRTWSWADFWGIIVDWIELFNSSQVAFGFLSMILFLLFPGSSLLREAFPQDTNSGKVSFFPFIPTSFWVNIRKSHLRNSYLVGLPESIIHQEVPPIIEYYRHKTKRGDVIFYFQVCLREPLAKTDLKSTDKDKQSFFLLFNVYG